MLRDNRVAFLRLDFGDDCGVVRTLVVPPREGGQLRSIGIADNRDAPISSILSMFRQRVEDSNSSRAASCLDLLELVEVAGRLDSRRRFRIVQRATPSVQRVEE
jgi:hypothetical protein